MSFSLTISHLRHYPKFIRKLQTDFRNKYSFRINYRKGLDNTVADALSRNVAMVDGDATDFFINTMSDDSGDIIIAQKEDAFFSDFFQNFARSFTWLQSQGGEDFEGLLC